MARDTERRRAELREKLIDLAEAEIARNGIVALRARALAEQAGCAVGAIYTVIEDMPRLVLAVNMRTFARLGAHVARAVEGRGEAPPLERLQLMADAYIDFASSERKLWRALFDIEMTADSDVPQWYLDELARLFTVISRPVSELDPKATSETIALRTSTLFSAVHGVMLLSLEQRLSGIPTAHLKGMVAELVRKFVRA